MRRMVFVETRSAAAASATVINGTKEEGLMRTVSAAADRGKGVSPDGAGSVGSLRSNGSDAQEGIVPGSFDADWASVLRHDAAGRSPTGNFGMALPMPSYYSVRKPSPIPEPTNYVGRIWNQ